MLAIIHGNSLNYGIVLRSYMRVMVNLLSANPEKWSNTLKQIVGNLPTICLSVFDHFMNLALKGLNIYPKNITSRVIILLKPSLHTTGLKFLIFRFSMINLNKKRPK